MGVDVGCQRPLLGKPLLTELTRVRPVTGVTTDVKFEMFRTGKPLTAVGALVRFGAYVDVFVYFKQGCCGERFVAHSTRVVFVPGVSFEVFVLGVSFEVFVPGVSSEVFVPGVSFEVFVPGVSFEVFVPGVSFEVFVPGVSFEVHLQVVRVCKGFLAMRAHTGFIGRVQKEM